MLGPVARKRPSLKLLPYGDEPYRLTFRKFVKTFIPFRDDTVLSSLRVFLEFIWIKETDSDYVRFQVKKD